MRVTSTIKGKSCADAPVMINGWKHHFGFLQVQVQNWTTRTEQAFPLFVAKLQMLGDSQFDMYTGSLAPPEIAGELLKTLKGFRIQDRESYFRWVESSTHLFWQLALSDGSEWTLRKGDTEDFYIHAHPARHAKHSRRYKANQLRTALATLVMANMRGEKPGLPLMNSVRCDYLGLSRVTKPMAREIFAILNGFAEMAGVPH